MRNSIAKSMEALPEDDVTVQSHLQSLAEEIVSVVSELDPSCRKEVLGLFVADLFSRIAEQERKAERRQRQAKGIAAAKARGVHFGKKTKPLPDNFEAARRAWRRKEMTVQEAATTCGMAKATFYNAVIRAEQAEALRGDANEPEVENGKNTHRERAADSIHHPESPYLPNTGASGAI